MVIRKVKEVLTVLEEIDKISQGGFFFANDQCNCTVNYVNLWATY